jgi:hypothetical protein
LSVTQVAAEPHAVKYQLAFPTPKSTGAEALTDFDTRADVVYRWVACGREERYLQLDKEQRADEDILTIVLAKLIVYTGWPNRAEPENGGFVCRESERYEGIPHQQKVLSDEIQNRFGPECSNVVRSSEQKGGLAEITYALSRECLRLQINHTLKQIEVKGTIGSTSLPCWPPKDKLFLTDGEWNITIRDLTRIYYINDRTGRIALDEPIRLKIRNELLTLDGRPGAESYNIGQCGNQENSTGTPEERAEEDSWLDNTLDDVGDIFEWLKNWLLRLATIAIPLLAAGVVLVALFGSAGLAVILTIAGTGAVVLTLGSIPETENHLLMIESDRYLNNQIILAEIDPSHPDRHRFESAQEEVREWLLKRLQRIAKEEFVEYNARAYQRYSIHAIRSLYDFARDPKIVTAAQNVLDLASAKMAIGSNLARRLVPYRRLMENVPRYIELNLQLNPAGHRQYYNGLLDAESGADHQISALVLYSGITEQAPSGRVSYGMAAEMVYIASSTYRPPSSVVDLAIDKSKPYQQRFKHDGVEIYSSTPGFLLTAGGIRSGPSSTIEIAGLSPGGTILGIVPLSHNKDRGAAVPTSLMLTAGINRSSLEAFLHIAGRRESLDSENATYDHNLCVWRGFACGINVRTPTDMEGCFNNRPAGASAKWSFFDTKSCPGSGYEKGPQVMIARYIESCSGDETGDCVDNIGFFEAVSEPSVPFAQFQQTIVDKNPASAGWLKLVGGLFGSNRTLLSGSYTSFSGEVIEFNTAAHQLDSDDTGIEGKGLGELGDWPRADGDVMKGDGESGTFTFINPNDGRGFRIDMSQWSNPSRQDF